MAEHNVRLAADYDGAIHIGCSCGWKRGPIGNGPDNSMTGWEDDPLLDDVVRIAQEHLGESNDSSV